LRESAGGRAGFSILGLGWKWDGTPIPASVRQRIIAMELGAAPTENSDEIALLQSFVTGQGAECFSQRGTFVKGMASGDTGAFTKLVISVPPKDLRDKSADGLLTALEVEHHIDRLIQQSDRLSSFYTDDVGNVSKLQFVIVVPLTIDAAATNIAAINKLLVKYRHYNAANVSGVLVLIATHLCLPHCVHIASRTVFASVQLPSRSKTTGKKVAGQLPLSMCVLCDCASVLHVLRCLIGMCERFVCFAMLHSFVLLLSLDLEAISWLGSPACATF
jgi:hypothetical protein